MFTRPALINILIETIVQLKLLHGIAAIWLFSFAYKSACSHLVRSTGTLKATLNLAMSHWCNYQLVILEFKTLLYIAAGLIAKVNLFLVLPFPKWISIRSGSALSASASRKIQLGCWKVFHMCHSQFLAPSVTNGAARRFPFHYHHSASVVPGLLVLER